MIVLSVAHSDKAPGAVNELHSLTERSVSERATRACASALSQASVPTVVLDCLNMRQSTYLRAKADLIDACKPWLAIEIHCNSSITKTANYGEVIYFADSTKGKKAADEVVVQLSGAFAATKHNWPIKGARPDNNLYLLKETQAPVIIVEGLFISNDEQASWLKKDFAAETYGLLVAAGLVNYAVKEGFIHAP